MDRIKETVKRDGYVSTIFGRRIHIPAIYSKSGAERQFGERAAINAPIQGAAADIIRRAMTRMPQALKDAGLETRMLLQVHDELVFEAPEEELETVTALIKKGMESAYETSVPLLVEVGVGDNWLEAH